MNTDRRITAIRSALALCDKPADRELPASISKALALLEHVNAASARAVANQAVNMDPDGYAPTLAAATTPAEFDKALENLATGHVRRAVIREAVAGNLRGILDSTLEAKVESAMPEVIERLAPAFDKATAALAEAASALPAGGAVFNPEAVLKSDAGSAYRVAHDALSAILTCRALWPADHLADPSRLPRDLLPMLPVLDVDQTKAERVNWQGHSFPADEQHPATASLHRLNLHLAGRVQADAEAWDEQRALIELSRTDWPGLSLRLAPSAEALKERKRRIVLAFTTHVDEGKGQKVHAARVRI